MILAFYDDKQEESGLLMKHLKIKTKLKPAEKKRKLWRFGMRAFGSIFKKMFRCIIWI